MLWNLAFSFPRYDLINFCPNYGHIRSYQTNMSQTFLHYNCCYICILIIIIMNMIYGTIFHFLLIKLYLYWVASSFKSFQWNGIPIRFDYCKFSILFHIQGMIRSCLFKHLWIHFCYKSRENNQIMVFTLTYLFSSTFLPLSLKTQAWVSKSILCTHMVKVVRILWLFELPVELSVCTFLKEHQ